MCGIFAYIGNSPDVNKVKILGLYNETRGGHSSGLLLGGVIYKGVDKLKKFGDFIENTDFSKGIKHIKKTPVIGHCRFATSGIHSLENAHPFSFKSGLIGVHNGTLHSGTDLELCKKYDIDVTEGPKVDSWRLYAAIDKVGFKVLDEYEGAAALLWTNINEPEVLYAYHGASLKYKGGKDLEEERPLFFLQEKDGVYISSLESSLNAIKEFGLEPKTLQHNCVVKFNIKENTIEVVYKVNRESKCQSDPYKFSGSSYNYGTTYNTGKKQETSSRVISQTTTPTAKTAGKSIGLGKNGDDSYTTLEKILQPMQLFWEGGRYYTKSGDKKCLLHGVFAVNFDRSDNPTVISDPLSRRTQNYAFYNGIMFNTVKQYVKFNKKMLSNLTERDMYGILSNYSMSPVKMYENNLSLWLYRNRAAEGDFALLFTKRAHRFKSGQIQGVHVNESVFRTTVVSKDLKDELENSVKVEADFTEKQELFDASKKMKYPMVFERGVYNVASYIDSLTVPEVDFLKYVCGIYGFNSVEHLCGLACNHVESIAMYLRVNEAVALEEEFEEYLKSFDETLHENGKALGMFSKLKNFDNFASRLASIQTTDSLLDEEVDE